MTQTLRAGFTYFAIVMGTGFMLGVIRVPFLVPRMGERWAELATALERELASTPTGATEAQIALLLRIGELLSSFSRTGVEQRCSKP